MYETDLFTVFSCINTVVLVVAVIALQLKIAQISNENVAANKVSTLVHVLLMTSLTFVIIITNIHIKEVE